MKPKFRCVIHSWSRGRCDKCGRKQGSNRGHFRPMPSTEVAVVEKWWKRGKMRSGEERKKHSQRIRAERLS